MTLSLHSATVPPYLRGLAALARSLGKAEAFCAEHGVPPADLIEARLADDMLPLAYQVKSTVVHSLGAIEGVRAGTFSPDRSAPPASFAALTACVTGAIAALEAIDPAEVDAFAGRDVRFVAGTMDVPFTAEGFFTSFSLPNFYFHAATAYDILRWKGVPLGKRDFLGKLDVKG